ncbi:MAG: hypothetical protein OEN20_01775 [Gammaproteobacteria bacterium]|nr:hypothetical protein [Gammaproteobacteria bacterium]
MIFWCAALLCSVQGVAGACDRREPTRETNPGPHDYSLGTADHKLWHEGDGGEPLFFRARVLDTCGRPVAGARVQILHANQHGDHEADRWRADLESDHSGAFTMLTVFPGDTGGIARHIHFMITHSAHRQLVTRLFFKNDPGLDHGIEALAMVLEEIERDNRKAWLASYEFVLTPK